MNPLLPLMPVDNVYHYYLDFNAQTVQMLLSIAANNDVQGYREFIQRIDPAFVNAVGVWNRLARTPLMVAAASGSIGIVLELISSCNAQLDLSCGHERVTALHCAASSGSVYALDVVILLLDAGADPDIPKADGLLPRDVTVASPQIPWMKNRLRNMLTMDTSPVSPARDELFLQAYKVYECAVEGPHVKRKCAFFHPGAGDRRRNPRLYSYIMSACKSTRGDVCRKGGDMCRYAHGNYEWRFQPKRFKTMLCSNGAMCRVIACPKAHSQRERRLRNTAPLVSFPVMELNEEQQQRFLNAARFTKYFMRRFPTNLDHNEEQLGSDQEATSSNS